jgi:hypothetical protein
MTGESFDSRGQGRRRPEGSGPGESFDSLQITNPEANCFVISRELRSNLTVCREALITVFPNISSALQKSSEQLQRVLSVPPEKRSFSSEESLLFLAVAKGTRYLSGVVSAVEALETILYSDDAIGDPSRRAPGEVPIQELVGILRKINDSEVSDVGSRFQVADRSFVDGSLRGLFKRHERELCRLEQSKERIS